MKFDWKIDEKEMFEVRGKFDTCHEKQYTEQQQQQTQKTDQD